MFIDTLETMANEVPETAPLTNDEISKVFGNIKVIMNLNKKFFSEISEKVSKFDEVKIICGFLLLIFLLIW